MKKLIVILMALIAYSTQALADKVSFTASAPDVVVVGDQFRLSYTVTTQKVKDFQSTVYQRIRRPDGAKPFSAKQYTDNEW